MSTPGSIYLSSSGDLRLKAELAGFPTSSDGDRLSAADRDAITEELKRRGVILPDGKYACEHDFDHLETMRFSERCEVTDIFYCRKCLEYREVER